MGFQGLTGFGGGATGLSRISILDADPGWDSTPVVANSLRFNNPGTGWPISSGDGAYLSKVFGTPTNTKIWTFSTWFKKCVGVEPGSANETACGLFNGPWTGNQGRYGYINIDHADQLVIFMGKYPTTSGDYIYFTSSEKLIDSSAWYHICVAVDTTQATESDRFSAYINGVEVTSWDTEDYPTQNEVYHINNTDSSGHMIGVVKNTVNAHHSNWFNGYQAETIFIDGQKKAASDFGLTDATANQWVPKAYTGTYGNNGFRFKYDNTSDVGEDSSGNNNDWTATNFSTSAGAGNDILYDSPSTSSGITTVGNYCTLNDLTNGGDSGTGFDLSNGNLVCTAPGSDGHRRVHSTMFMSSGKFYWEATCSKAQASWYYSAIGMARHDYVGDNETSNLPGYDSDKAFGLYQTARYYYNSTSTVSWGDTWGVNDVIGCAWDNGSIYFYKNGSIMNSGTAMLTGLSGEWSPIFHSYKDGEWTVNFGQRPFAYTNAGVDRPAADFLALTAFNLDATTILSGTYEGNGDADGPVVWMNGTPATLKIGTSNPPTSSVAFDPAVVDPLANGFKIRHASTNNVDGTTYYWLATLDKAFKYANAQTNE